jgi:hypothetical protein
MLGKRSAQYGLFDAYHLYLDHVGQSTFSEADRAIWQVQRGIAEGISGTA